MGFFKTLNHFWRKPEQKLIETGKGQRLDFHELSNFCVVKTDSYPCSKCKIENEYCRKLQFADRTICVSPKEQVNSFKKTTKK